MAVRTPTAQAFLLLALAASALAQDGYRTESGIVYATVDSRDLRLNAFLPAPATAPAAAMVEIHGGWFTSGAPPAALEQVPCGRAFAAHRLAVFSVEYRLGREGGFPQAIRDCRNAVRFVRANAARFGIDPGRIGCTGISAGGYLSLMTAMVPESFDDGGPTAGLAGVPAGVRSCFSFIGPTDLLRFWDESPSDERRGADGVVSYRAADPAIPNDARPRLRLLFKGVTPDSDAHRALYLRMSPIAHVRHDLPPLLVCDGERDPIVPGRHGQALCEALRAAGADATYWLTPGGGHGVPGGPGFAEALDRFLDRTLGPVP